MLNGIKSMYVNSVACVRVRRGESECFRIDSSVRERCIMPPCLFNRYGCSKEGVKMVGHFVVSNVSEKISKCQCRLDKGDGAEWT